MSSRVIVVVDDLLFNRVILTRMLNQVRDFCWSFGRGQAHLRAWLTLSCPSQLGFSNVLCFESGAKLLNCSEEVGFILLDIVMPYLVSI